MSVMASLLNFQMDHLPSPQNPAHPPVEVPFLCGALKYDGGLFLTYPHRRGWSSEDLINPSKIQRVAG